jgi:ribonuclease PH
MALAIVKLMDKKLLPVSPIHDCVAAISVGIINGAACLDLDYKEDYKAEVDMNLVMTGSGKYVEVQGTAEKTPFSSEQLEHLQQLGTQGIRQLVELQKSTLQSRADLKRLFPLLK